MVQVIDRQGGAAGFGQAFGQGLSDQIPKEVEHYRLSQGLKRLGEEKNLSPLEFATKAYGIKGITPQMVDSLGQLARYQNQVSGYKEANKENPTRKDRNDIPVYKKNEDDWKKKNKKIIKS